MRRAFFPFLFVNLIPSPFPLVPSVCLTTLDKEKRNNVTPYSRSNKLFSDCQPQRSAYVQ